MAPKLPCWSVIVSTQSRTCSSSPVQAWPSGFTAHALCRPHPLAVGFHLTTRNIWSHLAEPFAPFKAFLKASGSKSFADISSYPRPAHRTYPPLHGTSSPQISTYCCCVVCVCMRMHVCASIVCMFMHVQACICIHSHVCAHMWRSEDNVSVIFINAIYLP